MITIFFKGYDYDIILQSDGIKNPLYKITYTIPKCNKQQRTPKENKRGPPSDFKTPHAVIKHLKLRLDI